MRQDKDNSWLDPWLDRQVHRDPAEFDFDQWARRYPEEARLLEQGLEGSSRNAKTPTQSLWRCIMQSKVTRYSVAAVVALAATLVLVNPLGISRHGGVALAAVQERVAQINTAVLRGRKVVSFVDEPNISLTFDVVKYISRQYGYAEEGTSNGMPMYRIVLNRTENRCLIQFPPLKMCLNRPCTEGQIRLMEKLTPNGVIDVFLETGYKNLGPSVIDGMDVEGFEIESIKSLKDVLPKSLFDIQEGKGTVWVRTKDLLPIRLEGDFLIGKSLMTLLMDVHLHEVAALESHDVDLGEELFNVDVPEGYKELKLTDFLPDQSGLANPASEG